MSSTQLSLDVVVVNYNAGDLLSRCIRSVLASTGLAVRCVLVDNNSTDDSVQQLETELGSDTRLKIVRNLENGGFAKAVNQGVALGNSEWVLLLNPDAWLQPQDLAMFLAQALEQPSAGLLGPLVLNPDGTEQRGCRRDLPKPMDALVQALKLYRLCSKLDFNHTGRPLPDSTIKVPAISGSCMLVRRQAFDQVNGFDEGYFLHFEDLDFCARMQAAHWDVMFVPSVRVKHAQGGCSHPETVPVGQYKAVSMMRYFTRFDAGQRALLPVLKVLLRLRGGRV